MIHGLINAIFRFLPLEDTPNESDRAETRHHLSNFLLMAVTAGGLGALVAFVAWYTAQL
jgi:hypothetical protein